MQGTAASKPAALIRYRDPKGAIEWLRAAFQFEPRFVATRTDGSFAYAHMGLGAQQITLTARDERSLGPAERPDKAMSLKDSERTLAVEDIAAHFATAKAAGAKIVRGLEVDEDSTSGYACRDIEGNVWTFRAARANGWTPLLAGMGAHLPRMERLARRRAGLLAAGLLTLLALALPAWHLQTTREAPAAPAQTAKVTARPSPKLADGQALEHARFALAEEQAARTVAEASRRAALEQLAKERTARREAERDAHQYEAELAAVRATRAAAEHLVQYLGDDKGWDTQIARAAEGHEAPQPAAAAVVPVVATPRAAQPFQPSTNPVLAAGQAALAKGDVEEARRIFRRLAEEGVAAAALALGSTYDPVNVAQRGLAPAQVDRAQAKQWYRRAIELAQGASERQHTP